MQHVSRSNGADLSRTWNSNVGKPNSSDREVAERILGAWERRMIKAESKAKQDQRDIGDAMCSFRTQRSEILKKKKFP